MEESSEKAQANAGAGAPSGSGAQGDKWNINEDCDCPEVAFFDLYGDIENSTHEPGRVYSHEEQMRFLREALIEAPAEPRPVKSSADAEPFFLSDNPEDAFPPAKPHRLEHILQKIEAKAGPDATWQLRDGWIESAYAGVEFGMAPASPEQQERMKLEEDAAIHRLNHQLKQSGRNAARGGGRPSKRQQQRTFDDVHQDVRAEIINSEPFDVMIDRMAGEVSAPISEEQYAKLSPKDQFIYEDILRKH